MLSSCPKILLNANVMDIQRCELSHITSFFFLISSKFPDFIDNNVGDYFLTLSRLLSFVFLLIFLRQKSKHFFLAICLTNDLQLVYIWFREYLHFQVK